MDHPTVQAVASQALDLASLFVARIQELSPEAIQGLLVLNHAIIMSNSVANRLSVGGKRPPLIAGFIIMVITAIGSLMVTDFMRGVKPLLLRDDRVGILFLAVWLIIGFSPFNIAQKIFSLVKLPCYLIEGTFLASAITGSVELAVVAYPGSHVAVMIYIVAAVWSGNMLGEFLTNLYHGKMVFPSDLVKPSFGSLAPVVAGGLYYYCTFVATSCGGSFQLPQLNIPQIDALQLSINLKTGLSIFFALMLGLASFAPSKNAAVAKCPASGVTGSAAKCPASPAAVASPAPARDHTPSRNNNNSTPNKKKQL